jgi:murein DD-endopeptidase MepM/ murein hydrolase activator NlpD
MMRAVTTPHATPFRTWLAQTCATLGAAVGVALLLHAGASAAAKLDVKFTSAGGPAPLELTVQTPATVKVLTWQGADIDGDGAPDFANPTGKAPRQHDSYGYGAFGASRDGGSRPHEGVDYMADAGQDVVAPISGFVTKIGFAYADDANLKFVEITNPALGYAARVFYIEPTVEIGQSLRLGETIGQAHGLQSRYPGGMTDHVHMEVITPGQKRIDATRLLAERYETRLAT